MKGIKFAIGFAFVLTAASLAGNWFLYERFDSERILREELQAENDELKEENNLLDSQLSQVKQNKEELERLQSQVKEYADQRDTLKGQLNEAESELTKLRTRVQDLSSEKSKLVTQVGASQAAEKTVAQEAKKVSQIAAATKPTPPPAPPPKKEAEPPKKEKEKKEEKKEEKKPDATARAVAAAVPAARPTPQPVAAPPAAQKPEEGEDRRPNQVLSVNRQFNFVVVNLGLRDRLKVGDNLRVEEAGKLVGRVQVEKLYENFSACKIVEEIQPAQIKEGDLVRIA